MRTTVTPLGLAVLMAVAGAAPCAIAQGSGTATQASPPASTPVAPEAGEASLNRAFEAADAAYKAYDRRDFGAAVTQAREATRLAPENRAYWALLMNAAQAAGQLREAEQAASAALAIKGDDAVLLAQRGYIRKRLGDAAGAKSDFEAALSLRQLPPANEIPLLVELGRLGEARSRFGQAQASGSLGSSSEVEQAYLAVQVGDDEAARRAFARADAAGKLPPVALQDAAFAAMRAGHDAEAVSYLERTVSASQTGGLQLSPQSLFETRRAVSELSRRWGVLASLNYRGGGGIVPGFGAVPGGSVGTKSTQVGTEAYWRPFRQHNGRYGEVFVRGFQTLESETGATGPESRQTSIGARIKPLTEHNAVLSLARTHTRNGPNDWLFQAAYSRDQGTDVRLDAPNWWTTRISAEAGRYSHSRQSYGIANFQGGRSYRILDGESPAVAFPHLMVAAEYDSAQTRNLSVGAGPGVSLRYWFRGTRFAAPQSYFDLSLQYRAHLSGDQRTKGLFVTALMSF